MASSSSRSRPTTCSRRPTTSRHWPGSAGVRWGPIPPLRSLAWPSRRCRERVAYRGGPSMLLLPRARFATAPRWLVRTGNTVVGPVPTHLLVRGVIEGRVPRDSLVREERSLQWRTLEEVRELSSVAAPGARERVAVAAADLAAAR